MGKGSRKERDAASMARRPGFTRKSLTCIAPASRRRVRRISVTSAREAALLLGKFSAPLQLCALTRRTRRLDAEATAARVLDTRTDVGASSAVPWRVPRPHAAAATRRSPGGSGRAGYRFGPGVPRGETGWPPPCPRACPGGKVSRPVPACPVHAIAVTKRARPVCESEQLKR